MCHLTNMGTRLVAQLGGGEGEGERATNFVFSGQVFMFKALRLMVNREKKKTKKRGFPGLHLSGQTWKRL